MNTILLVEDEPNQRLLYRLTLEDEGHRVLEAADTERALAAIRDEHVDLMVLDLGLPGSDGCAVLDSILELAPELPVIIYSGYDLPRGLPEGWTPDAYLVKNSKLERLKMAIERVLTGHPRRTSGVGGLPESSWVPVAASFEIA